MANYDMEKLVLSDGTNNYTLKPDTTLAKAGVPADAKKTGEEIEGLKGSLNDKANTDGSYESMTVGNAEQLVSTVFTDDSEPYNFRPAGGNNDIGDRLYEKLVGVSLPWNQLFQNGNFADTSVWQKGSGNTLTANGNVGKIVVSADSSIFLYQPCTTVNGHKYILSEDIKGDDNYTGIVVSQGQTDIKSVPVTTSWANFATVFNSNGSTNINIVRSTGNRAINDAVYVKNCCLFDLTAMFGSTIADYIYSLETANAGAGVAWFRKLFPNPYYAYDAGSLQSVQAKKHVTVGFNQWDEEWEVGAYSSVNGSKATTNDRIRCKNYIPVFPSTTYYITKPIQVYYYDADYNYIDWATVASANTFTTRTNAHYITFNCLANTGTTYNHDICINLHWDGERDGEYEPYVKHEYPLDDSLTLRGIPKLDASNHLYYDGDVYESDGTVTRRYGIVDLGSIAWVKVNQEYNPPRFYSGALSALIKYPSVQTQLPNAICSKYKLITQSAPWSEDKVISITTAGVIYIMDSAYSTANALRTALDGVYLVYELATPTTEEAAPFQSPQVVDDFGTEEYVDAGVTASTPTRDVAIPVGHESQYSANLRAKLEMAPDSPSDGDGDYLVRQTSGENEYVKYVSPVPALPSEDGTYSLKVTVSGSTKTVAWVADE